MTAGFATSRDCRPELPAYFALLGWAIQHKATLEAYRRSTGEDVGPVLERYRLWCEENVIGKPEDFRAPETRVQRLLLVADHIHDLVR
jgi:hypothetical protein